MYNGTSKRIRVNIVVVVKQYVLQIVTVCVTLVFQHAVRMRRIVKSGPPGCTLFLHHIS